jgi:hypothetical protein
MAGYEVDHMSKHPPSAPDENAAVSKRSNTAPMEGKAVKKHASQNPFAVFTEWTEDADEKAYADL